MVVPDDAVVYAPTVAAWLLAQPVAGRIACRPQTTVAAIEATGVLLADGSRIAAGAILLANGLQAPELLPSLPIQAKKGHLLITDRYPGTIHRQILELGYIKTAHNQSGTSVAFTPPTRPTEHLLIGSSPQFSNLAPPLHPPRLSRL